MKQKKYILGILMVLVSLFGFAQTDGPGNPGGEPQLGDPPLGGGAPLGSGTVLLIGLGVAYASYKFHKKNNCYLNKTT